MDSTTDLVVIGGGLSGLAAAAYAGRAGLATVVIEKAKEPGGRATTSETQGFSLNLGAHALYRGGPANAVLDELGVAIRGREPSVSGGFAFSGGELHTLPVGFLSLVSTGLFGLNAKLELARILAGFARIDAASLDRVPLGAWLERALRSPETRALLAAFLRVATYTADLERLSAGAAIAQLKLVYANNVLYLDGGWRTLVDGLRAAAAAAGVAIRTGMKATAVEIERGAVAGVRLADGTRIAARAAIVAASPHAASALFADAPVLAEHAARATPVTAACLDVALSSLPRKRALFALGIDRPLYASVHSAVARLAPEGGAVIHTLHYSPSGDPRLDENELAQLLDKLQPGWRDVVVERRFLPSMIVSNALVTAEGGGLAGRPSPEVPGVRGLWLAGDWIGREGMLADASLASARSAASLAAERCAARPAA
jgi:phytoene dehydrogenase-like protein